MGETTGEDEKIPWHGWHAFGAGWRRISTDSADHGAEIAGSFLEYF
jgi:hypothetical protein